MNKEVYNRVVESENDITHAKTATNESLQSQSEIISHTEIQPLHKDTSQFLTATQAFALLSTPLDQMTEIVERSPSPKSSSRFRELGHKPCTTGTPCPEGGDYSRGTVIGDKSIEPTSEEIAEVRLPSEDLPQQFDAMKHSSTPLADFEDLDHAKDMPPEALFHAKQLRDELVTTNSHPEDAKNPQPVYSQASHSENGCSNQPVVPHQSSPRIKEGFTSLKLEKPSTSTLFENITTHDDLFGGSNVVEDSFFDHLETPVGETNYIQPSEQQGYNTGGQQYASQEQQYAYFQQDQPSAQYNDVQSHDHQNTQQQYRFDASYSQPTDYNPQPTMNPQYGTYQNPPQSYAFGSQESFYNHATANQSSPLDQSTIYSQTPDSQPVQPVYSQQDSGYRPVPPIIMYNQQSHTQHDEPIMSPTTAKRLLNGYGDPPNIPYSMDHKSTYGHNQNQQYYNQLPQYSAAYQYQRSDQHQSQLAPPKTPSLPPSTFGPPAQPQSPHLARPQDAISRIQQIQSAPSTSDLYSSRPTTQDSGILHPRQTSNTSSNGSYHGHEFNSGFYTPMSSTFPASPFYGPSSYLSPKRESKNVSASTSFVAAKGGYSSPYDLPPQIAKQKPRSLTTPSSALAFNNPVVPSLLPPPKSLKAFSDAGSERGGSTNTFPGSEMPVPNREPQIYAPMEENYLHQPLQPLQQEKQSLESPFMPSGETFSPVVAQTADAFPLVINESNEEMFKSPFPSSQSMKKEMPKSDYYNPRRHRPPSISEPQIRHGYQGDPPLPLSGQTVDDSQKDPSEGSDYKPYGQYGNCPPTTAMNTALQAIQQSREKKQSFGSPPRTLLSSVQKRAMMRPLSPIYTPPPQASQINPYLNSYALPDVGSQEPLTNARLASPQGITDILDDSPGKSSSEGPQAVREEARGDTIDDYSIPNAAMDSYAPITINPNPLDEGDFAGHDSQLIAEELADGSENNGRYTETNAYKPLIPERVTSPTYSDHSIPSGPPKRFASPYCPDSYTVSPVMSPSIVPITVLSKPTSPPHAASLPPHISQKRPHAGTNPSNPKSASSLAQMQRSVSPYAPSGPSTIPSFPTSTYNQSTYETQQKNDPSEYHNFGTGHPLITFGFGGKIITMFPHQIQRYAADGSTISKGAPGLMNIANLRDYIKAEDHTTFPGPVYQVGASKGAMKAKRKECSAWLQNTINKLDNETFYGTEVERQHFEHIVILFKLLKVYTDHETPLDGSTEIEVACKEILMPGLSTLSLAKNEDASFTVAAHLSQGQHSRQISDGSPLSQYPVTKEFIASIGQSLLRGDREGAIRSALDNRMWAHAMLIASCVSKDRWKSVVKEFVRTELENAGEGSESLKVLYEVFAGHGSDAVEELLPPSSLFVHSNTQVDISGHLDRWRETLTMILANKTAGDTEAIAALGTQLGNFGFTEASHSCYILSRDVSTFEAIDAPKKNMVLVGASHEKYPFDFYRDHDAIKLSEIYELVKCNGPTGMQGIPHLQAYKLYYAWILSDFGMTSTAQRYCEAIGSIIHKSSKSSAHYHPALVSQLQELSSRLMDSPDSYEANSKGWTTTLSRSKFDKVLGSLEGKFKNFVSGDEEPEGGRRSFEGADTKGPFARIASDTGTITKVASMSSLRESYTLPSSTYGNDSYPIPHQNLTRAVSYGGHQPVPHSYHPPNPYEPMQPTINDPPSLSMTRQNESYQYETPPTCAGGHLLNVNTPAGTSAEDDNSQFLTPMHGPPLPSSSSHQNATVDSKETDFVDDEEDDLGLGTTRKKKVEVRDKEEKEIKSKKPVQVKKEADESDKPAAGGWLGRIFGKGIAKQDQGGKVHRVKLGDEMKLVYDEKLKRWVNPNNKEAYMAESALPPPPPRSRSATPGGESTSSSIVPPLKTEQTASSTLPGLGGSAVMSAPGSRSTSTVPSVSRTNSAPLRHQESIDDLLGIPAMTRKGGNAGRKGAKRYVDVFQNQS